MYPHRIRLRDPWETEAFGSIVRRRRFFHKPTQLSAGEAVWLVVDGAQSSADLTLNGKRLGEIAPSTEPWACEVTSLLGDRNELVLDFAAEHAGDDASFGNVRLEIRLAM